MYNACTIMYIHIRSQASDWNCCVKRLFVCAQQSTSLIDSDFGAESSNTVGSFSLKNDITPNANGSLLLDIASENCLRHVTSHFSCTDSKRWTWRHPRYTTRAALDHIFIPATQMRFAFDSLLHII